uniref:Fatty acyl-CoA reductase n=1 Tax=Stomoxys calcitrans TaxID=35570 RepID=A0A1I8PBY4_STOCA
MIAEFFENREIFLTGGSGVVGKALVEKLLRSCNVRKIYILLRTKRNATIEERMKQMKMDKIFRRLNSEKPNEFLQKVVPVPGDVTLPMLGITNEYLKLMENVSIIYHSAATVRFNETIKDAIRLNVGGTYEALKFGQMLKYLDTFIYISTFFSNPYLEYVEPKMYEAPMNWKFCLDLCQRNDIPDETMNIITNKLIVGFPNTYTFTKNLAESLVNDYRDKLPVALYRPSIVIQAFDDPEPGFPTSLSGAMALFTLTGAGILKTVHMANDIQIDMAPLDITTKSLLYYTVRTFNMYTHAVERPNEVPIYHVSSCNHTEIKLHQLIDIMTNFKIWQKVALEKSLLLPGMYYTESTLVYRLLVYTLHIFPALLVDTLLRISGQQPALMKIQRKIFVTMEVLKPFMFNNYRSDGITYAQEMLKELHCTDFDMDPIQRAANYYSNVGICLDLATKSRDVLFNEDPSTIPRAKILLKIKELLYRLLQLFVAYKIYYGVFDPIIKEWSTREYLEKIFNDTLSRK